MMFSFLSVPGVSRLDENNDAVCRAPAASSSPRVLVMIPPPPIRGGDDG